MVIRLHLGQGYCAFTEIVVLPDASAVLLVAAVEKLAAIVPFTSLENHEIAVVCLPVYGRAGGELAISWLQANFCVSVADLNILSIPFLHGVFQDPLFGFGDVWNICHG